ncbi:pitrilysin family protein [Alisedimentitalea sp. MJ-SS2]|uniref:M16 family metallopeptidase n=1 Tax=Aliisedimentitalea sp. MJ-SS2 TaxID=3049795 RepID=UPI00290DAA73|nr:pitrilysin family protein [Alisedimentitalea sp. MJ-SS2]MDU8928028.1 pitrilysin family protein [Alisedimentitalea sp. MJ-SS2]
MRLVFALSIALTFAVPARAGVEVQEITSPGGIDAWLVEERSIPFVALELRFKGGGSLDAPGKRGATALMTHLLEEGAGDRDARAFARAAEGLAASFKFRISDDNISVSAKFLTENRDEAVALLRDALGNPRFDTDAIERVRAQVLSGIRSDLKDPDAIAGRTFDAMVFGDHPYGSNHDGTEHSVAALTRDDLAAAHRGAIARDRLFISAVGDISADELGQMLDILLGDLPENGAPMAASVTPSFSGGVHVTDFETPQSVVLFGQPGIGLDHPDFFPAYIIDTVLGGSGQESRLMREVREKRGLTYGVYTYTVDKDHADYMAGSVASANDRVAEAIAVIQDEWQKMRDRGITEQELEDAKTYLTGAYPLRFDGNGPIARIMANMQASDMQIDYIANRNDRINAVTLDEVNRVARELLDPKRLTFVVVGQPAGLSN